MNEFYLLDGKKVYVEIPEKRLKDGSYSLVMVRDEDYNLIATFTDRLEEVKKNERNKRTR